VNSFLLIAQALILILIPMCSKASREHCTFTIIGVKAEFPVALATACPIGHIRNYMRSVLWTISTPWGRLGEAVTSAASGSQKNVRVSSAKRAHVQLR
jgi:hypothetical protein